MLLRPRWRPGHSHSRLPPSNTDLDPIPSRPTSYQLCGGASGGEEEVEDYVRSWFGFVGVGVGADLSGCDCAGTSRTSRSPCRMRSLSVHIWKRDRLLQYFADVGFTPSSPISSAGLGLDEALHLVYHLFRNPSLLKPTPDPAKSLLLLLENHAPESRISGLPSEPAPGLVLLLCHPSPNFATSPASSSPHPTRPNSPSPTSVSAVHPLFERSYII